MLEGYALEVTLTAANSAAQAWYGYDQGVISGLLISPDFVKTFPQTRNADIQGITASSFSLGNLVGCLIAAVFGGRLGRKNTLRIGGVISLIGAILQFTAYSFPQLLLGRIVNGVGNGMLSSTCGIFQAESCASERRGKLSVIVVLHNVVFYCLGTWITLGTSFASGGWQWRLPLALQAIPCFAMMTFLAFVPESPRWLLMNNRTEEGLDAIRRYSGTGLSEYDPIVQTQYQSIKGAIMIEKETKVSFRTVLTRKDRSNHLKRLLLGCGGQFMQQFSGINALNYYFAIILTTNLGLSELLARILNGVNATSYLISSALAFWIIDRAGRRPLMLTGLVLQCLAYIFVAIAVALLPTNPYAWGAVAVSFLFFYYAAFGCTWGMIPWVYQSEVNSLAMRTVGAAAATSTNWLFGFVATQFTPTGIANIGYRFYIIFAVFNFAFIFVVYFLYPETANRTLEDLDAYFDRDSGHPTIIPVGDTISKSSKRPQELIDAEASRIAMTVNVDKKISGLGGHGEHEEYAQP
ncbi:general substrate transporter [Xylariaceae sp. FL1272]|nr:general substrate transporter [Xylariaceae sp. FL1272]